MKEIRGKTIFHAQNSQNNKRSIFEEKGVTLIALIVMIIIIIIIASITINVITGDDSLIEAAQTSSLESRITQYQAEVEEAFQNILLKHYTLGEEVTIEQIAKELLEESWITGATPESDNTIRVTVIDGYQYLLYYNESTGDRLIAYLGTEDAGNPVTVTIDSYSSSEITVTATCNDGISTIELIYNGAVYGEDTGSTEGTYNAGGATIATHTFSIKDTGVFYVKATSTKDVLGYNYARISLESIPIPIIYVSSEKSTKVNGWYGADGEELVVTISVESGYGIEYTIEYPDSTKTGTTKSSSYNITISTLGSTIIHARAVDSSGNTGLDANPLTVKFDNIDPEVDTSLATYTGTNGNNQWYTTNVIISLETAISDTDSGPYGYKFYTENNANNITGIIDLLEPMTVQDEGETLINIIGIDTAGNEQNATLTVLKDSLAPISFTPTVNNISAAGFTVYAGTRDNTSKTDDVSGISHYNFYIGDELYKTVYSSADGETVSCDITGLKAGTNYVIKVEAVDNAGNVTTASISSRTESLEPPTITVSGTKGNNDWYISDIKVTITGNSNISGIKYVVTTSGSTTETIVSGTETSFTISTDTESYTIVAYSLDSNENPSDPSNEVTVKRDATKPTATLTMTSNYSSTTAQVTAKGTDETSGVYSYTYERSTSSSFSSSVTNINFSSSNTDSYSYTGLSSNKSYYIRVTVTDKAGNTTTSNTVGRYCWLKYDTTAISTATSTPVSNGTANVVTRTTTSSGTWPIFDIYESYTVRSSTYTGTTQYYFCLSVGCSAWEAKESNTNVPYCYAIVSNSLPIGSSGTGITYGVTSIIKIIGVCVKTNESGVAQVGSYLYGTLYELTKTTYTKGSSTEDYEYSNSSSDYPSNGEQADDGGTYYWYVLQ